LKALPVLLIFCTLTAAQSLEDIARAYGQIPSASGRIALQNYAAAHPKDETGAFALLSLGAGDLAAKRYAEALPRLEAAAKRLPHIADHVAFFAAQSAFELGHDDAVARLLEPVWKHDPESPLIGRGALLSAKSFERAGNARKALEILQQRYAWLPQPAGDLAAGIAFEAASDPLAAVPAYQRVYYNYPVSDEAEDAGRALARLRAALAERFPPAMPGVMVGRAVKLLEASQYKQAKSEFEDLVPQLGGAERDAARLRIAVADYDLKDTKLALAQFESLRMSVPDFDAERLYWVLQCHRRVDDTIAMQHDLDALTQQYPQSRWRLDAIVSAANYYVTNNKPGDFEPLFHACYEMFPNDTHAAYCHWKVAFSRYMRRDPEAAVLLRSHVRMYPKSDKAAAALYFLGRLAETASDASSARGWYSEIQQFYPNTYYSVLAKQRLADAAISAATATTAVTQFLRAIPFTPRVEAAADFAPAKETRRRIERARLLASAGLDREAETELRFGVKAGDQPQVYALELARSAARRSAPDQAIRYIKAHAPGYLLYPVESVPEEFWKLAFPLPYRAPLLQYANANGLDPYMVAALIRQESEFNTNAVSRSNAYGLTQVLPSTGRELARRLLRNRKFRATSLFQPEINLQLGTAYLHSLLTGLNNRWEPALAAYNAGKTRAVLWLGWADYREPAEFVESIPISETRNYVQIVIRNAAIYRNLYTLSTPQMKQK
jgi:soluble lytic murein transglycosylase